MACLCSWSITLNSQQYRLQPQWNETALELQWVPVSTTSLATTDQLFQLRIPSHATSAVVQHYELWFHQYQTWLDLSNQRLLLLNEQTATSTSSQYIPVEFEWNSSQDEHALHKNLLNATTH
jgi:hypothetical protein